MVKKKTLKRVSQKYNFTMLEVRHTPLNSKHKVMLYTLFKYCHICVLRLFLSFLPGCLGCFVTEMNSDTLCFSMTE